MLIWCSYYAKKPSRGSYLFYKTYKSSIDLLFTNRKSSSQLTQATEKRISELVSAFMEAKTIRLKHKKIIFRDYKYFDEQSFLEDLQPVELSGNSDSPNENYNILTCDFLSTVNNHAPLKPKFTEGNNAPFIDK